MNTVSRLFRKYLCNSVIILAFFLLINIVGGFLFLFVIRTHTIDSDREISIIAQGIRQEPEGQISITDASRKLLEEKKSWAMILNDDGHVIWDYQMPSSLSRKYSVSEVAGFSRWYLEEYPVLVQRLSFGLLVVGYQPDDVLGISMVKLYYVTDSGFLYAAAIGAILLVLMNIFVVIFLFWKNTKKIEKEIVPIMCGIEKLANGEIVNLSKDGELANINEKLTIASEHLRKKEKTRAEWINGVSHDVRTPLSLIMGYSGEIMDDSSVSFETKKRARVILGQAEKIKRLITDLNLVTRLESSVQPLRKESMDFIELGREVLSDYINNGLDDRFEIEYDISGVKSEFLWIEGDRYLLRRMLENLIQNSISHNPDGCLITLSIQENEHNCIVSVYDNGLGVSNEKIKQLNHGRNTYDDYMENGEAAHGYGLKLVRQIAEAHKGEIMFKAGFPKGFCTEITWNKNDI